MLSLIEITNVGMCRTRRLLLAGFFALCAAFVASSLTSFVRYDGKSLMDLAIENRPVPEGLAGLERDNYEVFSRSKVWRHFYQQFKEKHTEEIIPEDVMLPMRDGVKLFTFVWSTEPQPRPTVLIRSPYGPFGTENLAFLWIPFGYNIVGQNDRATGDSEGNWTFFNNAWNDGYDTMAWIANQSWSNGVVFQMGASADGFGSYGDMRIPQPHLYGQWNIFSTSIPFYTMFQNGGAYRIQLVHDWLGIMQMWRPNAPNYVDQVVRHEGYSSWWAERVLSAQNYKNVNFASTTLVGWYDIFTEPNLESFWNYQNLSSSPGQHRLIVGPRGHCFLFDFDGGNTWFPNDIFDYIWGFEQSLDVFRVDEYLPAADLNVKKALSQVTSLKNFTLYVMGSSNFDPPNPSLLPGYTGMYWTTLDSWPTPTPMKLFFLADHALASSPNPSNTVMNYTFDPSNPVPTVCGNNLFISCGPCDQTPIESRSDVLLFTTTVLTEPLAVLGPIDVELYVASNRTDTDFTIKVSDVFPNGESILITDQLIRMRWRDAIPQPPAPIVVPPSPIVPGQIYKLKFKTWSFCQVFNKGHKLRVAISSSNFPRFSVNPNNGLSIAQGGPLLVAENSFFVGGKYSSKIILPTVTLDQIPDNII